MRLTTAIRRKRQCYAIKARLRGAHPSDIAYALGVQPQTVRLYLREVGMNFEGRYYVIARCPKDLGMSDSEIAATGAERIGLLWEGRPDVWREKLSPHTGRAGVRRDCFWTWRGS